MRAQLRKAAAFLDRRRPLVFVLVVLFVYCGALVYAGGLDFPLYSDENQFWRQTRFFAEAWPPSLEQVRTYPEPMTPLSFLIWAGLEHWFGGGISVGRLLNLVAGIAVLAMVAFHARNGRGDPLLGAFGLLCFPYFVPMSVHLYTDMLAALFVLAGFRADVNRHTVLSAVFFTLAIATRQYMVAFPLALGALELGDTLARRGPGWTRVVPHALASATILFWLWFFGGLGPTAGLERWPKHTEALLAVVPEHGLYMLICLGGYFVVPEMLMFSVLLGRRASLRALLTYRNGVLAAVVLAAFVLWPPVFGEIGSARTMGMFNRAAHFLVPNQEARLVVYWVLAWLASVRFARLDLGFWLLYANGAMMMYSTGWDKYLLPFLVVLWYLGPANGSIGPPLLWRDEPEEGGGDGMRGSEAS